MWPSWRRAAERFWAEGRAIRWLRSRCRTFRRKPLPASVSKAVAAAAEPGAGRPLWAPLLPRSLPAGGAKALVEKTCGTGCHSVEVVTSQRMNEKEWNAVVQNMAARGARASDAELAAIIEYLAKTLGR